MGKMVGYARVSTLDQNLDLQIDSILLSGCRQNDIYIDKASGAKVDRPNLEKCLESLEDGDTLVVWRLDRLGRSMSHLVSIIERLKERKVGFKSLCDGAIDTTTASGELIFNIFSSMAQFERRLIQERTQAGLAAARARGRKGGRPKINPDSAKIKLAKQMHKDKSIEISEICSSLNISRSTFYRYLMI